jgi:hypothetical protein
MGYALCKLTLSKRNGYFQNPPSAETGLTIIKFFRFHHLCLMLTGTIIVAWVFSYYGDSTATLWSCQ